MHAILRCTESCDCNKDGYERTNMIRHNASLLCKNHCRENTAPKLVLGGAAVLAALEVSCKAEQRSQLLSKSPADLHRGLRSSKIWLLFKSNLVASWMHLHNCRCFQEHLKILGSTGEVHLSVWEVCMWLPDRFTFCWCILAIVSCCPNSLKDKSGLNCRIKGQSQLHATAVTIYAVKITVARTKFK